NLFATGHTDDFAINARPFKTVLLAALNIFSRFTRGSASVLAVRSPSHAWTDAPRQQRIEPVLTSSNNSTNLWVSIFYR
ncbi:hypothetical protein, partial [Pseudomonas aeruginosa]